MPGLQRITWHELSEKGLPNDTVAAVNVAGQNVLDPSRRWTSGFKQNVWNSRVNTTKTLVEAISKSAIKPEVFVNISGVSLYRPSDSKIYTEDDEGEDFDYMSKLCLHWEKAAEIPSEQNVRLVRRSEFARGKSQFCINHYLNFIGTHSYGSCYRSQRGNDQKFEIAVLVWIRRKHRRRQATITLDSYR